MSAYWYIGGGLVLLVLIGLALAALALSPQFFTLLNVMVESRRIQRMRKDPRYEEIKDAEGNHLGFKLRATEGGSAT